MKPKSKHPDWVLAQRQPKTEIRFLNGTYYLYEATSKWNPQKKRSQKISGKLLGKITPEGFIESDKYKLRKMNEKALKNPPVVKEYGASAFLQVYFSDYIELMKLHFKDLWREVLSLSIIRLLYHSPIKNTGFYFEKSYLSELYQDITLGEKRTGALYRKFGTMREEILSYMRCFVTKGDHVLIDATNIISFSERIGLAKMGYNSKKEYDPQINLMLMFSTKMQLPVYYRVIPGSIREVSAFKLTLDECGTKNVTIIADKGFYSKENIETLDGFGAQYIIPLRRNSDMNDYSMIEQNTMEEYFLFQKRYIWYTNYSFEGRYIHLFFDPELKLREETDYLNRIQSHPQEYTFKEFMDKRVRFGTIALYTNKKNITSQKIYEDYKVRNQVETMIDAMKNTLMAETSYMQNEDAFNGWMLVNFIALQFYYKVYSLLKEKDLISKLSPDDLFMLLKEVRKVKINQNWVTAEISSKTQKLLEKLQINPIT
ncbi:MAG TPA: transposase [Bacteroidales bacterium]|nr:transposase [Bacteroidales bacterium]HPB25952.1 transposase [Bacteroidales bacterium]